MSLAVQKEREIVLQILFSLEMGGEVGEELVKVMMKELKVTKEKLFHAIDEAEKIWKNRETIDQEIGKVSQGYDVSRIGKVEKSVLRLSLYALYFEKNLAIEIIIAEAIRLTKKFSSKEGSLFVHALLDACFKNAPVPA